MTSIHKFSVGDKVSVGFGKTIWTVTTVWDRAEKIASEHERTAAVARSFVNSPRRFRLTLQVDGRGRSKYVDGCDVNLLDQHTIARFQADLAREADRPLGHCQVCDREIGIKAGIIAHHGYTRPWHRSGVQTASCNGARWKPYELDRTVLGREITLLQDAIATHEALIARQHAEHPPLVKVEGRVNRKTGQYVAPVMSTKGADLRRFEDGSSYDPYDQIEESWLRQMGWELRALRDTLTHQQARYAAWKAPEAAQAVA